MFFFIIGINTATKELGTVPNVICPSCGAYTRLQIIVTYEVLNLFFIPVFKWNRRYFATASCCGSVFEVDPGEGRAFERGQIDRIDPRHFHKTASGARFPRCPYCGAEVPPGARYCHMCGRPLN